MYEQHFGLKKRLFRANTNGTDVFVGPHIAATMAGLKNALIANDAIVTLSGPVGSGKTTLVNRALESNGSNQKMILVTRMRLDSNDVLELLLDELGLEERPNGAIQKFALFRRHLKKLAESDKRVLIAIEDAAHLGADTLAEIEALTAADAGESEGASIVLMGDEAMNTMLREAPLARVQQRIRQRLTLAALPLAEMRGYLRHCFRLAGRDFEQVFEPNAADLLHHLSDGIPRIANNLVESAMTAAADQGMDQVATTLLARIAENEYGLSAADFDLAPKAEVTPVSKPETVPELPVPEAALEFEIPELPVEARAPEPPVEDIVEPEPEPMPVPEPAAEEPVLVFADPCEDTSHEIQSEAEIPELIQDTLPDLAILVPEFAAAAEESEPDPEPVIEPTLPIQDEITKTAESTGNDVPAWDRDPTMAELKPDIAALEQAMAFSQADAPESELDNAEPLPEPEPEIPEVIQEITLDHAISQRIESNLIDEPGEISAAAPEKPSAPANDTGMPALKLPPKQNKKADAEIERIAKELAKAKSIEDVDDKLAETLFGDEINFVAAHVLANPPSGEPANDEHEVVVAAGHPVVRGSAAADVEVTLEAPRKLDDGGMDLSASQRLKTVRALNADLNPSVGDPDLTPDFQPTPAPFSAPESIEDQINTSMTQTLKALNVTPPVFDDDDDEDKGGFFSRFKRS
jgi:general secretion pathway protein A